MLHGTVKYGLKAGGESSLDWAAHARLVKEGEKVKMSFYQVYLVSSKYLHCYAMIADTRQDTGAQAK